MIINDHHIKSLVSLFLSDKHRHTFRTAATGLDHNRSISTVVKIEKFKSKLAVVCLLHVFPAFPLPTKSRLMRGFLVSELCHPSKIAVSSDVPEPKAGKDQVLVDVYSAGLNFFDVRGIHKHIPTMGGLTICSRFYKHKENIS